MRQSIWLFLVGLCLCCPTAFSTSWVEPDDLGVVCLDEQTGRPEWEYSPDRLTPCDLASDGKALYMVMGPRYRRYLMDPIVGANNTSIIKALDLSSRTEVSNPVLPESDQLVTSSCSGKRPILESGDRIAESASNRRAVVILKGDSDQIRSILPAPWTFESLYTHRNLIILTRFDYPQTGKETTYWAVAHDSTTHKVIWTLKSTDIDRAWGYGQGAKYLYLLQTGVARALDLETGKWAWTANLPRIRGFSQAIEHNGRVYVICDYCSGPPSYYLYCLDVASGKLLWMFDPNGSLVNLPLLFQGGKIYTQISPTPLADWLRMQIQTDRDGKSFKSREDALRYYFAGKPLSAIELNLRAWHAMGDRALLSLLIATGRAIPSVGQLARGLELSFPSSRDPMRLLRCLQDELGRNPELRGEVCEILDESHLVPFGYTQGTWGFPPRPVPKLDFSAEQGAVIKAYQELRSKAYGPMMSEFDAVDLQGRLYAIMAKGKNAQQPGTPTLESLIRLFHAAPYERKRDAVFTTICALYPGPAADWALSGAEQLTPALTSWAIQRAPAEWIKAHPERLESWVRSPEIEVRNSAAWRLSEAEESVAVPLATRLLEDGLTSEQAVRIRELRSAMLCLANLNRKESIPLIRKYCESPATQPEAFGERAGVTREFVAYPLREAAIETLQKLGEQTTAVTKGPERLVGTPEQMAARDREMLVDSLEKRIKQAQGSGDAKAAKEASRALVALPESEGGILDSERLANAFEILEDWDKLAANRLQMLPEWRHDELLQQMVSRHAEGAIEIIARQTESATARVEAARLLVVAGKADKVLDIMHDYLHQDPADWTAHVASAEAYFYLQKLGDADAAMERALSLLPQPSADPAFKRTITYWLDRGRPDRANAWVQASATSDFDSWQQCKLLDWAGQYPDLRKTLKSVLRAHRDKKASISYAPALGVAGGLTLATIASARWLHHRRAA